MIARALFAVLVGLATAAVPAAGRAETPAADPAADDAPALQIYTVPALADALRALALAGACPRTALPELVLADGATLARQIERGARADVLATDDAATLDALVAAGHLLPPRLLATTSAPRASAYWIAPLRSASRPVAAEDFVAHLESSSAEALLERYGLRSVSE